MRLDLPDTLAYQLDLPHRKPIPFGKWVRTDVVRKAVKDTHDSLGGSSMSFPDYDAVEFYALNQLAALIQARFHEFETLPPWALDALQAYSSCLQRQNLRLMHYVLLIITREARHLHGKESFLGSSGPGNTFTPLMKNFLNSISGTGSSGAVQKFLSSAPSVLLSDYTASITTVFNKGSFSGGYGGKPWGNIANTLRSYVSGETSAEVFLDTAYTLAHNNGPIFNKGMYYHSYSDGLKTILDVQRSGQVCELVLEGVFKEALEKYHSLAYTGLRSLVAEAAKALNAGAGPTVLRSYVDWFQVEKLGSLHKYPKQKEAQVKKHGHPGAEAPVQAPQAPAEPPKPVYINGVEAKETGKLYIMPSVFATTYALKRPHHAKT